MKIRASKEWLRRTRRHAEWIGVTRADLIRRCLRRWQRSGCVDVTEYRETATREESQPIEVDPQGLVGKDFTGQEVVAVVNWALAHVPHDRQPPITTHPDDADKEEGRDYVIKENE